MTRRRRRSRLRWQRLSDGYYLNCRCHSKDWWVCKEDDGLVWVWCKVCTCGVPIRKVIGMTGGQMG
jgi:hypothetical protein